VPGSSLRQLATRMRNALSTYGRGSTPPGITEYGPSEAGDATWGRINAIHEGAAWAATFVSEALAGGATMGSLLLVRDNFGGSTTGSATVPSPDHIRDGIDYPKAVHNAFQTYTMLPGSRVSVTTPSGQPNIRAVASTDGSPTGLLVYNYSYRFAYPTEYRDISVNENVKPGFSGLSANGNVVVQRYLIDANTSNVSKYLDANLAPDLAGSKLTRVEQCYSTVIANTLVLPVRTLGPSAVSLWVVKPYGGTVDSTQTCR
jgi:hypothetical protein